MLLLSMLNPFPVVTDSCYSSYTKSMEIHPNLSVAEIKCYFTLVLLHFRKKNKVGGMGEKGKGKNKTKKPLVNIIQAA